MIYGSQWCLVGDLIMVRSICHHHYNRKIMLVTHLPVFSRYRISHQHHKSIISISKTWNVTSVINIDVVHIWRTLSQHAASHVTSHVSCAINHIFHSRFQIGTSNVHDSYLSHESHEFTIAFIMSHAFIYVT